MLTWMLKRAWLPIEYDEPFEGSCWLRIYWEGSRPVVVHTTRGVSMTKVSYRYPAYRYEKSHHSPNVHNKVFVSDPDQYFTGSRVHDPEMVSLNSKEW